MPTLKMAEIIRRNREAGLHFFDPASRRFFHSVIGRRVYQGPGGVFFVTSERFGGPFDEVPRRYTLRHFDPRTGDVRTAGEAHVLDRETAEHLARKAAAGAIGPQDINEWRSAKEKAELERLARPGKEVEA